MKNALLRSCKASIDMSGIVIDVILVISLVPVIITFISQAQNLTQTEVTLLGLTSLFIILGLIFAVGKQTGVIISKK